MNVPARSNGFMTVTSRNNPSHSHLVHIGVDERVTIPLAVRARVMECR